MDKIIQLDKPVRFGGHKVAHSIRVTTPVRLSEPIPIEVYYFNEGTEKQARKAGKRKLYHTFNPEKLKPGKPFELKFRFELSDLTFKIDREDVFVRKPFTFEQKNP